MSQLTARAEGHYYVAFAKSDGYLVFAREVMDTVPTGFRERTEDVNGFWQYLKSTSPLFRPLKRRSYIKITMYLHSSACGFNICLAQVKILAATVCMSFTKNSTLKTAFRYVKRMSRMSPRYRTSSCCGTGEQLRRLRWLWYVAHMGESRNAYRVLVGTPEGKRPLGRPRRRWEDNIKMDLRELEYDARDWINFAKDRDRWVLM
ncbi:hypothetical protein ANN_15355 [Periplaneta americana]|uniref:Uncharacterized protein n=1 Tax=Periplaneta americana TaxID=6978 RepID=A0ABQ8SGG2_PERAM|nr:hypothetical protein ANN_15355 [Periplaneta americana]